MDRIDVFTGQLPPQRKVVIAYGARTPFSKAFAELMPLTSTELASRCVQGLITKSGISPSSITYVVWGGVILECGSPNVARELVLSAGLPSHIAGHTESMACASGLKAILSAVELVRRGDHRIVIAGGSDSVSHAPVPLESSVSQGLFLYSNGRLPLLTLLRTTGLPFSLLPKQPKVIEKSTQRSMGWHADVMAQVFDVSRERQDLFAAASHARAAAATEGGLFESEMVPITVDRGVTFKRDNIIRQNIDIKKIRTLPTAFRKQAQGGTVTAATSSPLTDGAACCVVMDEETARSHGFKTLMFVRDSVTTGINPFPNLLLAPALGILRLLHRCSLTAADVDFFEIHEAFAAQVLATIDVVGSPELSQKYCNLPSCGPIPMEKVNIYGGSISMGHPFGATGARLTTNALRIFENHPSARRVLVSVCAAGGLGLVVLFERFS